MEIYKYIEKIRNSEATLISGVIMDAFSDENVHFYKPLLEFEFLKNPTNEETEQLRNLIEIFAFDDIKVYRDNSNKLPKINEKQYEKLLVLTLIKQAMTNKHLKVDELAKHLEIGVDELYEIFIKAVYSGLVKGKIDHLKQIILIEFVCPRDTRTTEYPYIESVLKTWIESCKHADNEFNRLINMENKEIEQARVLEKYALEKNKQQELLRKYQIESETRPGLQKTHFSSNYIERSKYSSKEYMRESSRLSRN
ncbi:hypothetical protein BB559_000360 [Furculomyces boomerangus]|uniref:PCI domain-containing protein n=2 Tax=Harpellales TaxID=61421 RepID=A0A2T9Z5I3_9FUNG|nr:hypothetical protein BB559_000360 [Furculomyces boomerangus]PWA01659.1 hypothetical protein BB558_002234 [Smittium angustum]